MKPLLRGLKAKLDMARSALESRHDSPDELLGELFLDVQLSRVFPDPMTFTDLVPAKKLKLLLKLYKQQRHEPNFNLAKFVQTNFKEYLTPSKQHTTKRPGLTIEQHIKSLQLVLKRQVTKTSGSLIALPYSYEVAGGRFMAQFYWDSYFVMLGLAVSGQWDMVDNMVKNCAYMIHKFGFVLNANRTYFASRSQPPFFALMLRLLASKRGKVTLVRYLPAMLLEYKFWMKGAKKLGRGKHMAYRRVVRMPGGETLNRYYDHKSTPRPEGYKEDVTTALNAPSRPPSNVYLDLRAGAESGWDFSSRWLGDGKNLATIQTTNIVPIDLNCLLVVLEQTIALAYESIKQLKLAKKYHDLAKARADAINNYCWSEKQKFYYDFNFVNGKPTSILSLAGVYPLFAGIASADQANHTAQTIRQKLLKKGGLLTTTLYTDQQWDAPNGWAPLQWIAVKAFRRYGFDELANKIKARWLQNVNQVYNQKGKLVEKYNVVDPSKSAGGGEYLLQDGFGWTNGVVLALMHEDALNLDL